MVETNTPAPGCKLQVSSVLPGCIDDSDGQHNVALSKSMLRAVGKSQFLPCQRKILGSVAVIG